MPQTTSAQREPSMEEILASIRRIIEDSDGAKKYPSDAEIEQPSLVGQPATAMLEKGEVEAFRSEFRTPPEPSKPAIVASRLEPVFEKKPISLAEIQAEMKRALPEIGASKVAAVPLAAPAPLQQAEAEKPAAEAVVAEAKPVSMADIEALLDRGSDGTRPSPEQTDERVANFDAVPMTRPVADVVQEAGPPMSTSIEAADRTIEKGVASEAAKVTSIISAQAGRQVAAAFGELSEAFAASRQKSFDDMAEQMMRPMLQDWFDNNLPILVERIVREEIERVARGV